MLKEINLKEKTLYVQEALNLFSEVLDLFDNPEFATEQKKDFWRTRGIFLIKQIRGD